MQLWDLAVDDNEAGLAILDLTLNKTSLLALPLSCACIFARMTRRLKETGPAVRVNDPFRSTSRWMPSDRRLSNCYDGYSL